MVIRNAGGRVSPGVLKDLAYIGYLPHAVPGGPPFEVTWGSTGTGQDWAGSPVHGTGVPMTFAYGGAISWSAAGAVLRRRSV
jgi:hypothetical protein